MKISNKYQKGKPVYVAGRQIGYVQHGTFFKRIKGSRHLLYKPPAIALDIQSLRDASAAGAECVQVTDTDSGRVYRAPISRIWDQGLEFDRGYGRQIALMLGKWERADTPQPPQLRFAFGGADGS